MKMFFRSLFLLSTLIVLRSSAWVTITLTHPAQVSLPQHIQTLILIDRTLIADTKKNKIESTVTGEFPHQDEQAVQQALEGVINIVNNGERLTLIRTTEKFEGDPTGKIFPEVLSWKIIADLCKKYNADAALVLESFDSDFILTNGKGKILQNENGLPSVSFYAEGVGTVNLGFRIYDPSDKTIIDEFLFNHESRWNSSGNSITDAVQGIMNKNEAVKQVSYDAGIVYGQRITPTYYKVTRYFYDKPKKNKKLSEGVRKSKVADWQGAIDSWQEAMETTRKDKHKGRIALNIAVGYEVLGNLDKALEWAGKSYVEYEEKMADDYVRQLKDRKNEEKAVQQQMGE